MERLSADQQLVRDSESFALLVLFRLKDWITAAVARHNSSDKVLSLPFRTANGAKLVQAFAKQRMNSALWRKLIREKLRLH
jgi:hypothetical protein